MKIRTIAAIAGIVLAGSVTACGSSGSPASQNAAGVLQSDGYTPDSSLTSSLQSQVSTTPGISSLAAGRNSDGIQLVIVCTSPTVANEAETGEQQAIGSSSITLAVNGNVVTATGPTSAWASIGG